MKISPATLFQNYGMLFIHCITLQKTDPLTLPFSKQEFRDTLAKCSASSVPGPDHITWRHLKSLIANKRCLEKVIHIANVCIKLEYWPSHFKSTNTIVIPKPNKDLYNSPKSFHLIVLLNTAGKLIEKVISNWLQFQMSANGFLDSHQFGGCYRWAVIALSDHPRWMFRKNLMEFFVALLNYLYKSYSGYATISSQSHVLSFF